MTDFDTNRAAVKQEQFQIVEIDILEITGNCTLPTGSGEGYYTPLTCIQQSPTATKTYYFASPNTPIQFGSERTAGDGSIVIDDPIHRVINSITENPTELKPSEGLAGRGSVTISFADFAGDPSPINPSPHGTFLGKFEARNILVNNNVRIKYFHIKDDGSGYVEADALTKHYQIDTFVGAGKDVYILQGKDELTKADADKNQWPVKTEGSLRGDLNDSDLTIPVDADITYVVGQVLFIGTEFFLIDSVANIGTATATVTVLARGDDIVAATSGETLTRNNADKHSDGDHIQICHISDDERIDDLLEIILLSIGIDAGKLPTADWATEVDEWQNGVRINTLWHISEDANFQIKKILLSFLLDMWYDPIATEVKLSAISVWKETSLVIEEGKHIDFETLKKKNREDLRFTSAYIFHTKQFLAEEDSKQHYSGVSSYTNATLEGAGYYGEEKNKEFEPNPLISRDSANLLTQRFISRFGLKPVEYNWRTQERYLDFSTGDIVSFSSDEVQDFDGTQKELRGQVLKITPRIGKVSRHYLIKALTYEAAFSDNSVFTLAGVNCEINLHVVAGAPSQPVQLTFVLDGGVFCGVDTTSVIAGNFAAGSKLTVILINAAEWQGFGGSGGSGGVYESIVGGADILHQGLDGGDAGTCYDAQGVDTDIYLAGSISGYTADGKLVAPGGGGGGSQAGTGTDLNAPFGTLVIGGVGGGGGAGYNLGPAGPKGQILQEGLYYESTHADDGNAGSTSGTGGAAKASTANASTVPDSGAGGDWGEDGTGSGTNSGGAKGKAIIANGATVCVYGSTVTNYIQGGGDDPCLIDSAPVISLVVVQSQSDTTATITWETNVPASSQIEYGLTTGYGSSTTKDTDLVTSHSQTITGLTASTLYNFKVLSESEQLLTGESSNQTLTTDSGADVTGPVISAIGESSVGETSASINWTTDEGADSQVEYGLTDSYGSTTTLNTNLTTNHSEPLTGLTGGTEYHYRVISADAATNSTTSADQTFNTAAVGGETVSYPGGTFTQVTNDPTDSRVGLAVTLGGEITKYQDIFGFLAHDWVDPKSADVGNRYHVKIDKTGGTESGIGDSGPFGSVLGASGTWEPLTSSRQVWISQTEVGNNSLQMTISISDDGGTTTLESQSYTLSAIVNA